MGPAPCLDTGKGSRELQLGGASRAKLEEAAVKARLDGTPQLGLGVICPALVHPRSLGEEHKICVGDGTVRALAMASLFFFQCKAGWLQCLN